jgi:hypothetical protein
LIAEKIFLVSSIYGGGGLSHMNSRFRSQYRPVTSINRASTGSFYQNNKATFNQPRPILSSNHLPSSRANVPTIKFSGSGDMKEAEIKPESTLRSAPAPIQKKSYTAPSSGPLPPAPHMLPNVKKIVFKAEPDSEPEEEKENVKPVEEVKENVKPVEVVKGIKSASSNNSIDKLTNGLEKLQINAPPSGLKSEIGVNPFTVRMPLQKKEEPKPKVEPASTNPFVQELLQTIRAEKLKLKQVEEKLQKIKLEEKEKLNLPPKSLSITKALSVKPKKKMTPNSLRLLQAAKNDIKRQTLRESSTSDDDSIDIENYVTRPITLAHARMKEFKFKINFEVELVEFTSPSQFIFQFNQIDLQTMSEEMK